MNKTAISIFAFFAGTAVGGTAAWVYAKEKYARIAEEEIESVKAVYAEKENQTPKISAAKAPTKPIYDKPSIVEYAKKIQEAGYTDYSTSVEKPEQKGSEVPYIITPEEFGEIEEYTKVSLSYFADGVLADETNEAIGTPEEIVGDALSHFGEYEDDAVFVRNDAKRCDYEIILDMRAFDDILADRAAGVLRKSGATPWMPEPADKEEE